jgi:hypothetical protein
MCTNFIRNLDFFRMEFLLVVFIPLTRNYLDVKIEKKERFREVV